MPGPCESGAATMAMVKMTWLKNSATTRLFVVNSDGMEFLTDPDLITRCIKIIHNLGDWALREDYDPWDKVAIHGRGHIIQELSKAYKAVRIARNAKSSSISSDRQSPDKLAVQGRTPAQRPKIDPPKTSRGDMPLNLASKLRSSKKTGGEDLG